MIGNDGASPKGILRLNASHFAFGTAQDDSGRIGHFLDVVGANPCVRPSRVFLSNRFCRGNERLPIPGAHIGAPLHKKRNICLSDDIAPRGRLFGANSNVLLMWES